MKICYVCKLKKGLDSFHKNKFMKDGYLNKCKRCHVLYCKKYWSKTKDKQNLDRRRRRLNDSESVRAYARTYYHRNKEGCLKSVRKYSKKRWKNDIGYRLTKVVSHAIRQSLKGRKGNQHWEKLVDYNLDQLRCHLESLFKDDMSWQNYGKWHIDHIKPKSLFHYKTAEDPEFKECWSLENLQPLWARDNITKSNKFEAI